MLPHPRRLARSIAAPALCIMTRPSVRLDGHRSRKLVLPLFHKHFRTIVVALFALVLGAQADVLLPTNSVWRFFRGTNEASGPTGTEWRTNTFDDSSWEVGQAPFYFGYSPGSGTLLSDMQSNYTCIFLRGTFVVTNPAPVIGLGNRPS